MTFFLTSFILLGLLWEAVRHLLLHEELLAVLHTIPFLEKDLPNTLQTLSRFFKLGLLAGYTLFVFGFLSRRCERQADLFGAELTSTDTFISALEKVADLNGIPRDRNTNWLLSWQHPTICQRVAFLRAMRDESGRRRRFHRSIVALQFAFFGLLGYLLWQFDLPRLWKLLADF
jgi:Zn-dependent protease with chaperone function